MLGINKEEANGQIFNVGTGVPVSVREVAESLIDNYKIEVPLTVTGNYRLGDIRHNFADLKKISSMLGFKPKFTFHDGIKYFTQWVNSQQIESDNYNKSIQELRERGLLK